jgi:PST family polysaccharide transporter
VLLGFVAGSVAVGYYSAAEKLIKAAQGLVNPLSQSFYPRVSRLMKESHEEAFKLLRRLLRLQGGYAFLISLAIFGFAPVITHLLYGPAYETTTDVLRWLSPLPFVIALSNVFGIQTMLPLGMNKTFSNIVLAAGALNVVALYVLASWFGAVGAAEAVLFAEVAVTVTMAVVLHGKDIPIFEPRRIS